MDTMVRRAPLQETWGFRAATSVLCAPVGLQGRTSGKRWGVGASPRLTGALPFNRSYRKSGLHERASCYQLVRAFMGKHHRRAAVQPQMFVKARPVS